MITGPSPTPQVSDYWNRIKERPSFKTVFGPAMSGATAATAVLPGLAKAVWGGLTGRY